VSNRLLFRRRSPDQAVSDNGRFVLQRRRVDYGDGEKRLVWQALYFGHVPENKDGQRLVGEFHAEDRYSDPDPGYEMAWDAASNYEAGRNPERLPFDFTFTYFKPSGKFYSEGKRRVSVKTSGQWGHPILPYMHDAVDYVREVQSGVMLDAGGKAVTLPGLIGSRWEGHVLVNCEEGFPVLIPYRPDRTATEVVESVKAAIEAHRTVPDTYFI
jgi:hypothetical protein